MIKCDKCQARAIIYQKYSGMHLCPTHFEADLLRKVRESLRETKIFAKGARVAVALSGGKDSATALYCLKKIFARRRDVEILALMIDEGIEGYRPHTLEWGRKIADRLEVPLVVKSFREEFGITTDQVAVSRRAQAPCSFCGVMRKTLLNRTAREMGADALATGHNLDDEAQTVLLNYLRGDVERLFRLRPGRVLPGMVPRIKPLRKVPEKESATFALTHDLFPRDCGSCPYVDEAMRLEVKTMLNDFERSHPGTKYSLLRGLDRVLEMRPPSGFEPLRCSRCGDPCGSDLCQSCRMLEAHAGAKALSANEK
ncbi:MAG: TIGR00269 family protein [Methanotrichaceae archaeon]|nr:TIGR00269 family protein [Methanotrichaceae archaeon]